jgi:HK97 family phage prohead protease
MTDHTDIRGEYDRTFTLERAVSPGARAEEGDTWHASLSSETPVERWFGTEILRHTQSAVNMERAGRGLALLFNHNVDEPIGRVSDIRLDGTKLRGALKFSPNSEKGPRIAADVAAGFLGDVSIRYSIDEFETRTDEHGHDTITVTRWTPLEASIVTVPADATVGVGRSHTPREETQVTTNSTAEGGAGNDGGSVNVVKFKEARDQAKREGASAGAAQERERIGAIDALFDMFAGKGPDVSALRAECIRSGSTVDQARESLLALLAQEPTGPATTRTQPDDEGRTSATRQTSVTANGATEGEKLTTGIARAIEVRAKLITGAEAAQERQGNEFAGMTLAEMARAYAEKRGLRIAGLSRREVIGAVFREGQRDGLGMPTASFTGILANVANKSLLAGWEEAPTTWRTLWRIGSLNDFKRTNRTGLSGMDLLDVVVENGEYTHGDASDRTEYITAAKYGKLFAISREAIINDDLGAFTTVPRKMGRAADLTVNKIAIDLLCSQSGTGPTLNQDSLALFHATHANYTTTSGGPPTVARLEVGRAAMAIQTDPNNGMPLNIKPRFLFVPSALETVSKVLVASEKDPIGTLVGTPVAGATSPNPFWNALTVVSDPYLDNTAHTAGTVAWYLLGDPNMFDTMEIAFVDGQQSPFMESRDGWTVDGVEYKVRTEFGVAALDFRAMYRNDGA